MDKIKRSIYFFIFLTFITSGAFANECKKIFQELGKPLVKISEDTFEYQGLSPDGLKALKLARTTLQERIRLFQNELRSMDTIHHAGLVARLFKGNMFLYGPPGGAKSAFVKFLMRGEPEPSYQLQLHQMITEQAFIGGQNFEAAKQGQFDVNTKGSLADFTLALIDETEKGNPAALSALLSLLNEREILAGNKTIKARLETLFATSNTNLHEIFQQFLENGQGSTAPALLNRFQFKAFVYNWLKPEDQAVLDQRKARKRYLEALKDVVVAIKKDEVFVEPKELDWNALRQVAYTLFEPDENFMAVYREMVDDLRAQTNKAIKESEERHKQNHLDEPFVYFPSADYTERLRQQIPDIIIMSAFIDFLLSPLSEGANLERIASKRIKLDPLSLWRGYLVMTTLGPGDAKLVIDPKNGNKIDIDFGSLLDESKARDKREELLIRNLNEEQERFRNVFLKHINGLKENIELRSRNGKTDTNQMKDSFELQLQAVGK